MRPKPCQKISLKLEPDGKAVGSTFARAGLHRTHFVRYSHQLLNVVAHFLCYHVGLSKVSRCTKPVLQLLIEGQVDIDLFVPGTIKRSHCRPSNSARRLDLTPEKHQLRLPVLRAHLAEPVAPNILGIRQFDRDEPFEFILFWSNWTGRWGPHFRGSLQPVAGAPADLLPGAGRSPRGPALQGRRRQRVLFRRSYAGPRHCRFHADLSIAWFLTFTPDLHFSRKLIISSPEEIDTLWTKQGRDAGFTAWASVLSSSN